MFISEFYSSEVGYIHKDEINEIKIVKSVELNSSRAF